MGATPDWGIAAGVYPQVWLGRLPKDHDAAVKQLAAFLTECKALGLPGVAFHSGPRHIQARWPALRDLAVDHGLRAGVGVGLDGKVDTDGTLLTAKEKGECLGAVLADPACAFGLLDAEGQWETDQGPDDQTKPAYVEVLGDAMHKLARPGYVAFDQPWFAIESHDAFPSSRFAKYVRARAPQPYCNLGDYIKLWGTKRWDRIEAWMERDWKSHEAWIRAHRTADLVRPRTITIQGYKWDDAALLKCLRTWATRGPVFVWGEPYPDAAFMRVLRGFLGVAP